jgi:outer membrane protein assembly factor BamE
MKQILSVFLVSILLSGCSSWVYKYDIAQGNYVGKRDVDKLRVNMTKEQVKFVLGTPLVTNPFSDDKWHFVYTKRVGKTNEFIQRNLVAHFENNRLVEVTGDFELPEAFNTPLDE